MGQHLDSRTPRARYDAERQFFGRGHTSEQEPDFDRQSDVGRRAVLGGLVVAGSGVAAYGISRVLADGDPVETDSAENRTPADSTLNTALDSDSDSEQQAMLVSSDRVPVGGSSTTDGGGSSNGVGSDTRGSIASEVESGGSNSSSGSTSSGGGSGGSGSGANPALVVPAAATATTLSRATRSSTTPPTSAPAPAGQGSSSTRPTMRVDVGEANTGSTNPTGPTKAPTSTTSPSTSASSTTSSSTTASSTTSDPGSTASTTSTTPSSTTSNPDSATSSSSTTPDSTTTPDEPLDPGVPPSDLSAEFVARRLANGAYPGMIDDIRRMGVGAWIEDQLSRTGPDSQVEGRFPSASVPKNRSGLKNSDIAAGLTHAALFRGRYSRNQLFEAMTTLWADHLNVHLVGGQYEMAADYQEDVIRPNAMGRFHDLLQASAESPAMLRYLDNRLSNGRRPGGLNENYGRELLELHTVGAGNHSEADMVAAAKIMSGWTIRDGRFQFVDTMHADETVTVLGRQFPSGGGKGQGDELLAFLARHPDTARMVAAKICRRFVVDQPPASLIESAAQVYLDNDTQIVPVLRHILASSEFVASANQKLRRPIEFMVAVLRATDSTVAPQSERRIRSLLGAMGNEPWGWPAPNGYPDVTGYWADTSGFLNRWAFAAQLCRNRLPGLTTSVADLRSGAGTAAGYLNTLAQRYGLGSVPERDVAALLAAYELEAGDDAGSMSEAVAQDLAALLLCHPGFQLR